MVLLPVCCPCCGEDSVVKKGKTEQGKQRYLCLNGSNSEHSRTRYKSIV